MLDEESEGQTGRLPKESIGQRPIFHKYAVHSEDDESSEDGVSANGDDVPIFEEEESTRESQSSASVKHDAAVQQVPVQQVPVQQLDTVPEDHGIGAGSMPLHHNPAPAVRQPEVPGSRRDEREAAVLQECTAFSPCNGLEARCVGDSDVHRQCMERRCTQEQRATLDLLAAALRDGAASSSPDVPQGSPSDAVTHPTQPHEERDVCVPSVPVLRELNISMFTDPESAPEASANHGYGDMFRESRRQTQRSRAYKQQKLAELQKLSQTLRHHQRTCRGGELPPTILDDPEFRRDVHRFLQLSEEFHKEKVAAAKRRHQLEQRSSTDMWCRTDRPSIDPTRHLSTGASQRLHGFAGEADMRSGGGARQRSASTPPEVANGSFVRTPWRRVAFHDDSEPMRSTCNPGERLYMKGVRGQERRRAWAEQERARAATHKEEAEGCTFTPAITELAQALPRDHVPSREKQLLAMQARERRRERFAGLELAQCTFHPQVGKASETLAQSRRGREGTAVRGCGLVHDRLYCESTARKQRQQQQQEASEQEREPQPPAIMRPWEAVEEAVRRLAQPKAQPCAAAAGGGAPGAQRYSATEAAHSERARPKASGPLKASGPMVYERLYQDGLLQRQERELLQELARESCRQATDVAQYLDHRLLPDLAHPLHSSTPLHSTPLHSTPLHSTPLHSTPLHSTPLHSTPLHSTPLHSTPLHSTPLHSTPLHSTPLHSTPLHSTPLHSTPLHSTPLHSTPLHSTPLHSTPLHSTPLHSTPLHSTPLHSTPLHSTPLHSTPLHSTPLHSTPLHSTPLHSTPLHSTPLHSTPLHSTPLHSTPLHSTPLHSTPLHSTPLHSTPLHSTPLHSTPLHSTPLHSTPLHSTPLHSTPLLHSTQHHTTLRHATPWRTPDPTPHHTTTPHHPTPYHPIPHHTTPHHTTPQSPLGLSPAAY